VRADQWTKRTVLTVKNDPIQIRDTVLESGQYVLRLLDSQSDRPRGHTQFTFWGTPPGTAKAMRMWYYPGDNMGQEFPYPTHLQQIALLRPEPAPAPQPPPP